LSELALTDRESRRLKSLEDTIRRSAGDMYDAMRAIHDEKLYRDEFETWETYCKGRWGMSAQYANRLIEHGRVLALMTDEGAKSETIVSLSETATREVSGLPDDEKVRILTEVVEEEQQKLKKKRKVTAKAVRKKVQEHQREPGDESEASGGDPIASVVLDELKRPVPKHLTQKYELAARIKSAATKLDAVKKEVTELVDLAGGVFLPFQQIEIAIKELKGLISHARYYTECPRCKGKPKDSCDRCDGHGFLPYSRRGTLSAEDKAWLGIKEE
jgi:hypothetical protein